jgi:hypothetical protein
MKLPTLEFEIVVAIRNLFDAMLQSKVLKVVNANFIHGLLTTIDKQFKAGDECDAVKLLELLCLQLRRRNVGFLDELCSIYYHIDKCDLQLNCCKLVQQNLAFAST